MTTELEVLIWLAGLTIFMWLPYIFAHIVNVGLMRALTYQADGEPLPDWATRAKRAHYNSIENLAPFAGLVIVAHLGNVNNDITASAALAFLCFRVAHYVVYTLGIPFGRTLAFAGSWLAQICFLYQILIA